VRIVGQEASGGSLNAQNEVEHQRTFIGRGADTDIVVASAKAYLAALNKLLVATGKYGEREYAPAQSKA